MKALLEALRPGEPDWELAKAIDPARLPAHIAIIMDGNGRWAGQRRLPRVAGHKAGVGPVRSTVETCARLGVKALTLYAFSVENWKRPRAEVETLWRLLRYYLKQELPELQKNDIRLQAIGRLDALPSQVRRELESAVEATSSNRGMLVNLAINYGARHSSTAPRSLPLFRGRLTRIILDGRARSQPTASLRSDRGRSRRARRSNRTASTNLPRATSCAWARYRVWQGCRDTLTAFPRMG
jgi:undecaprenyl diphosphate synthase